MAPNLIHLDFFSWITWVIPPIATDPSMSGWKEAFQSVTISRVKLIPVFGELWTIEAEFNFFKK